jgi:hypothetical protein
MMVSAFEYRRTLLLSSCSSISFLRAQKSRAAQLRLCNYYLESQAVQSSSRIGETAGSCF